MKPLNKIYPFVLLLAIATLTTSCGGSSTADDYTEDGKLKISMRNLYFEDWGGADAYTDYLEDKFKVSITPTSYSYNDWTTQVSSAINGNNLTDVFQFNVTQFNYGNSYKNWANGLVTKALPDDLSPWPNLKNMIDNTSSIDSLKINGHLYGIPIAKNITKPEVNYSPFTYVYRRDWAKKWNVYQENDEYTWEQFQNLVAVFHNNLYVATSGAKYAMADVEWGYPSITNFYKDSPHCFSYENGKYVSTFTTEGYLQGLDLAKSWTDMHYYGYDQYNNTVEGGARKAYTSNKCGVLYENLSLSNFQVVRDGLETSNHSDNTFALDDATAIMKVKGPDGKYALEGTDNWFSMTLFNYDISDTKMKKVLDVMDYLLGAEGTKMAVYGLQGYDYTEDGEGNITLTENGWPKDDQGNYVKKVNGAKCLRYLATLGNDYASVDPLTDSDTFAILNAWDDDMSAAVGASNLRVVKERDEVIWLSLTLKDKNESSMLTNATASVIQYCYGKLDKNGFVASMNTSTWTSTLNEINNHFGY